MRFAWRRRLEINADVKQRTPARRDGCYAVGMASMIEIFVWWPLIAAVPVAIVLGVAMAAMFSDKP